MTLEPVEAMNVALPVLMAAAANRRDALFGTGVTYSPKVFIPLTMLCRDRCGYCTFAKAPARRVANGIRSHEAVVRAAQHHRVTVAAFQREPADSDPRGVRSNLDQIVGRGCIDVQGSRVTP